VKSVRLLPVVIFAALALLLFKGIGLVTSGGYVLTGPTEVLAAGGAEPAAGEPAAGDMGDLPEEVVIADTSPTLDDSAPTMVTNLAPAADHAAPSDASHGESSEDGSSEGGHEIPPVDGAETTEPSAAAEPLPCPVAEDVPAVSVEPGAPAGAEALADCIPVEIPLNEHGDALPLVKDGAGKIVPLELGGDDSEDALVARLSERRAELDQREADIGMRLALLEAAEKRLDQRTEELAALEARVAQLVDEKQAAEEAGFKAVVSMYETMKPKEAAKIFDTLRLSVLLKVARSMNPRKMSPILAAMSAQPAQQLTTALAAFESTDVVAEVGENLAALPQIVGQ
jgi:flagellar motility protein MotE (MotC chaperone)